jgi:archaellum component FlaC
VWRRGEDLVDRRRGGGERDRLDEGVDHLKDRDRGRFEDRIDRLEERRDRQGEVSDRLDDRLDRLDERLTRLEERAERLLGDRGRP